MVHVKVAPGRLHGLVHVLVKRRIGDRTGDVVEHLGASGKISYYIEGQAFPTEGGGKTSGPRGVGSAHIEEVVLVLLIVGDVPDFYVRTQLEIV